ncbi:MAG: MFS transporter [Saprospiraceae bacterium]|nr:MFS transporter [Saprospiraceae bacterium]MDW8483598.1 MFS transporter [Saprospiraceae bacterium]
MRVFEKDRRGTRVVPSNVQLGLRANWRQFTLLVIVNAFVGGMVGMERAVLSPLAEAEFGIASKSATISFVASFGFAKALANYYTGYLANWWGRRRLLIVGWILATPVPLALILAPSWEWVIGANVLLGASQGFTWSSTVIMKIDLVGEKNRGLAMGLNEFAGYLAVGLVALLTGWLAERYGLKPYPFYLGVVIAVFGLMLSAIWVKDTRAYVLQESLQSTDKAFLNDVFWETTWRHRTLGTVTQAGFVNNLNDGMIWGLFPLFLMSAGYSASEIGLLVGAYPVVWGVAQLFTGKMADHFSRKGMLFYGMLIQGLAIVWIPYWENFLGLLVLSIKLGVGTALVYPTFLVTIAQTTHPQQHAESIGVFRLWRDFGYAAGALLSGLMADLLGIKHAIFFVGVLTLLSAAVIQRRMPADA